MAWQLADCTDLQNLVEFLSKNEWGHVGFSARLNIEERPKFPEQSTIKIHINRSSEPRSKIKESILTTGGGLVVPVLSDLSGARHEDISSLLSYAAKQLHSVMGLRRDVEIIEASMTEKPFRFIDYHLMTMDRAFSRSQRSPNKQMKLRICSAHPRHIAELFPLQAAYEKEEVLLNPYKFNTGISHKLFQQNLKKETILFARMRHRVVAKAGTNALGFQYAQLGGVYTLQKFRNRGIGTILINSLINHLGESYKGVSLFVKKDNPAALRLYEKTGFEVREEFRISYYK